VTVTVVWIAVGRFAGILGLASVTDYLRARTGKRSVLHRSPRHRHRSRGDRLRETLRAADAPAPARGRSDGTSALPLLGRLHATCAAADDLEQATIVSSPAIRRRQRGTCVLGHVSGTVI